MLLFAACIVIILCVYIRSWRHADVILKEQCAHSWERSYWRGAWTIVSLVKKLLEFILMEISQQVFPIRTVEASINETTLLLPKLRLIFERKLHWPVVTSKASSLTYIIAELSHSKRYIRLVWHKQLVFLFVNMSCIVIHLQTFSKTNKSLK